MPARIVLTAFGAFMVYLVVAANTGVFPEFLGFYRQIPYGDAVGHFCLMGTLSFLAVWATKARAMRLIGLRLPVGAVVVLIVVVLEEVSQLFVAKRTFSVIDLTADFLGIVILGGLATRLVRSAAVDKQNPAQ